EHGADIPIKIHHLWKRPLIRQWLYDGKLYREKDEREPSRFELFFDLMFVGIVHQLADGAAESGTGLNVLKFALLFWPSWSVWTDVRTYLNTSGTDDVKERLFLLGWMIILCGYSANASGVKIEYATPEMIAALLGGGGEASSHERRAIRSIASFFLRRASTESSSSEEPALARHIIGNYYFTEGYDSAINAAITFYLIAKLWRLGLYFYYGVALPKFRKALMLNAFAMTVIAAIYIPIAITESPVLILILMSSGIVVEVARSYLVAAAMKLFHGRGKHRGKHMFIPALSQEHSIERHVLFVILIVGESIINSTFVATSGTYGANEEFGRSALAISIAFMLIWLYYDADASRTFQHALRRNWFTSITFCHLHFPLTASLILMSSSLAKLVSHSEVSRGYLWYFGGSLATAVLCIGLIGLLHRNLDKHGSNLYPRWMRLVIRFVAAIIFALIPIKEDWKTIHFMGCYAGILFFIVTFETIGKLGAVGRRYDAVKAERYMLGEKAGGADPPLDTEAAHAAKKSAFKLSRRDSWHPFEDLTPAEKGEEDVGIETEIGHLEEKTLTSNQKWAYAA
ncbi:hypothetical protein IE53DRAFT_322468, partial [Violaceomyces palustris]